MSGIPRRHLAASAVAAGALLVGSLLLSIPTSRMQSDDPSQGWAQAVSKKAWVIYHQNSFAAQYGSPSVSTTRFAAEHGGVTVFAPCFGDVSPTALHWAMALTGGMSQIDMDVLTATCPGSTEQVLGNLPQYLLAHPEVTVNALALDEDAYRRALAIKDQYRLSNLRVVPERDIEQP